MKQVMTVLGPVDPEDLGVTLMHEHLFVDIRCWLGEPRTPEEEEARDQPISLLNLGLFRRDPMLSRDNLILDDMNLIIEEALRFKRAGGGTIVEVTPIGIGRDPSSMQEVAHATGLNIVCGCGFYIAASHPPYVATRSKQELAGEIIRDLMEGIGETGVRAGIIGEIGLSPGIPPDEEKSLRAAAIASRETGAAITIHTPWPKGEKLRVLDILEEEGADLTRVIMGHLDYEMDVELNQAMADRGAYLQIDCFGQEHYREMYNFHDPLDIDRVAFIAEMVRRGYVSQILISQDVATKVDLRRYAGWGYAHISEHVERMLKAEGVTEDQIRTIRVDNPRRVLPL
jgi:phosphotriesterase-related protein